MLKLMKAIINSPEVREEFHSTVKGAKVELKEGISMVKESIEITKLEIKRFKQLRASASKQTNN